MALPNIRPSFSEASSSTPSAPSNSTSESTGSDPRHTLTSGDSDPRGKPAGSTGSSKRRRVPDSITRNACQNCKKARAKCDGKKPCARCNTRSEHSSCIYEVHIKHAKEELVKEITDLRAKDRLSARILRALQSESEGPETLRHLRSGEPQESLVAWLDRDAPPEHKDYDGCSPPVESNHDAYQSADEMNHDSLDSYWANVKADRTVRRHLFNLFFNWIHPTATIISERHFCEAYDRQTQDFCSPLLVNAMCALACSLHNQTGNDAFSYNELGQRFAAEFREQFDPADKRITTIQATALMFLFELAQGSSRAAPYLKQATDSIMELSALANINLPPVVLRTAIQGIRCLNVEWAQAVFECPLSLSPRSIENNLADDEILDSKLWYFYRNENDHMPGWPSLLNTVNREKLKLINIIGDVCAMMYGPASTKITALQILTQYARFVAWSDALPEVIAGSEKTSQSLPHALTLLILYNHSVTQLLRPLLELNDFPSLLVEEVIFAHAQRGLHLLERHYRAHFTCRYQPGLQTFVVANLCDIVARYYPPKSQASDKDGAEALILGLDVLQESFASGSGFRVAGILRELLRRAPATYATPIKMPPSHSHILRTPGTGTKAHRPSLSPGTSYAHSPYTTPAYTYEEFMDACTRATYFQPLWGLREKFEEGLAGKWVEQAPRYGFRIGREGDRQLRCDGQGEAEKSASLMQIKNVLNTPYPRG